MTCSGKPVEVREGNSWRQDSLHPRDCTGRIPRGIGCFALAIQSSPATWWMMTRRHSHSSKHMRLWRESVIVQIQAVSPQSWGSALNCTPSLSSLQQPLVHRPQEGKAGRSAGRPGARTWSPHLEPAPAAGSKPRPALRLSPALAFPLRRLLHAASNASARPLPTSPPAGVVSRESPPPPPPGPRRHPRRRHVWVLGAATGPRRPDGASG